MVAPHEVRMPHGGVRLYGGFPQEGAWREGTGRQGGRYKLPLRGKHYSVSRLVCEAFNGPPPPDKPLCLHIDEDVTNNTPSNLVWGTQKENLNMPAFLAYCRQRRRRPKTPKTHRSIPHE
jgi:HNH endonuclease